MPTEEQKEQKEATMNKRPRHVVTLYHFDDRDRHPSAPTRGGGAPRADIWHNQYTCRVTFITTCVYRIRSDLGYLESSAARLRGPRARRYTTHDTVPRASSFRARRDDKLRTSTTLFSLVSPSALASIHLALVRG